MTTREQQLFDVVKELFELNKGQELALTGSLMLAVRDIPKRREASDIDVIAATNVTLDDLVLPDYLALDTAKGYSLVSAANSDLKIKIDFLFSDEFDDSDPTKVPTVVKGILCAQPFYMLEAKQRYAKHDKDSDTKRKHEMDIEALGFLN